MKTTFAVLALSLLGCGSSPADATPSATVPVTDVGSDESSFADAARDTQVETSVGCPTSDLTLASLVAHNTSASPHYDQAHFPENFGTSTWISQGGEKLAIDPKKVDLSLNPVTPGHVSQVSVHTLVPSRPDLRWFAHITPWFRAGGGGGHVDIGLEYASAEYVASMVADMKQRGFDGVIVDWYGKGSYSDSVTLLLQKHLATLKTDFTFIVMMDKGIAGLSQSVLETQVKYVQSQYFVDPRYEREGGKPILMFFGVDGALGGSTMAAVKSATGGDMVWVAQGAGSLGNAWVDQAFDWTHDFHDGPSPSDPYALSALAAFHAAVAKSEKRAFGSMVAGFNGTLTKKVAWSMGKYLPRDSGACLVEWAKKIDAVIPKNVTRMQWATWSDWEEGTSIEGGVENDVAVHPSLAGDTLQWTLEGNEATIDHFEIYASTDGVHALDLGSVDASKRSFDLRAICAPSDKKSLFVDAVGKANIRNHLSDAIEFTGGSR